MYGVWRDAATGCRVSSRACEIWRYAPSLSLLRPSPPTRLHRIVSVSCVRETLFNLCRNIFVCCDLIWHPMYCDLNGFVYSLVDLRARLLSPATFSLVTVWMGECQCQLVTVTESGWKLELFMFWLSAHSRRYADWVGSWWSTYLRYELCQVEIQRDVSITVCCLIIISHRRSSSQLCCMRCVGVCVRHALVLH